MKTKQFLKILEKNNFTFFTGVPCSIFKDFLIDLQSYKKFSHIAATSEGEACGIAAGFYLASGHPPAIYMQNSGLGNAVNPLTSLLDKEVYSIPALLLISWRGEPGKPDEPQHKKMGKITLNLLKVLGVPTAIPKNYREVISALNSAKVHFKNNSSPFALIFKKDFFQQTSQNSKVKIKTKNSFSREQAIKTIIDNLGGREIIVSTTGKTSRELFEYREVKKQGHSNDFYTVGSMGCASSIALGLAISKKTRHKIIVLDGDGAALMKLGNLATIGHYAPKIFYHFILDNNSYESTGGQTTVSGSVDFTKIAKAVGYKNVCQVKSSLSLSRAVKKFYSLRGPALIVIKVSADSRENLGRPTTSPSENKINFINFIKTNGH